MPLERFHQEKEEELAALIDSSDAAPHHDDFEGRSEAPSRGPKRPQRAFLRAQRAREKLWQNWSTWGPFILACLSVVAESICLQMGTVLWPLLVRNLFDWGAIEYAYLVLTLAILRVAFSAVLPPFQRSLGTVPALVITCALSAATSICLVLLTLQHPYVFSPHDDARSSWYDAVVPSQAAYPYVHSGLFLGLLVCLRMLELQLKSFGTVVVPPSFTSRAFGLISSLMSLGGVLGSLVGTRLYASHDSIIQTLTLTVGLVALISVLVLCTKVFPAHTTLYSPV
jgi:hypothetical protein